MQCFASEKILHNKISAEYMKQRIKLCCKVARSNEARVNAYRGRCSNQESVTRACRYKMISKATPLCRPSLRHRGCARDVTEGAQAPKDAYVLIVTHLLYPFRAKGTWTLVAL